MSTTTRAQESCRGATEFGQGHHTAAVLRHSRSIPLRGVECLTTRSSALRQGSKGIKLQHVA
eukprot:3063609-Amphidinium_carterae.1